MRGRQNNRPPKRFTLAPRTQRYDPTGPRGSADVVKPLEVGRGGWIIWVCNPRVLVREAGREIRVRERQRAQKETLLVLK